MSGVLYLAWRHLRWHRWKSLILVTAVTLVMYLPLALQVVIERTATDMTARANTTPLLLGARGSPLELVLNGLYFSLDSPAPLNFAAMAPLAANPGIVPIPLYVRYNSQGVPIVGTDPEYFRFRGLGAARGRLPATLGEAVLGAQAAERLGVDVGDGIVSSPASVFDIAGVYPLRMPVVGVLERVYNQDDNAIFVDLKTSWIIEGLGHGHQDLAGPEAASSVLKVDGDTIVANASLVQYNEITPENIDSFHFHGSGDDLPLTAIIPVARDRKQAALLLGDYQSHEQLQLLQPREVIGQLLDTVFAVQRYVLLAMALVAVATSAVVLLVLLLSWRARRNEQLTLFRLGGSRGRIAGLMLAESALVIIAAAALTALLSVLTLYFSNSLIQALVL